MRRLTPIPAAAALAASVCAAPALAQGAADIERLTALIEAQQRQIDALRAELDAMKAAAAPAATTTPPARRAAATPAPRTAAAARAPEGPPAADRPDEDDRTGARMVGEGFVWKEPGGRSLTLSGQINPAFNIVDDGVSTEVFVVDNDTSSTRFRLDADAPLGATRIGATLEIGASPNNSSAVSQLDPETAADFDVRLAEVSFRDDRFGRLQLGQGSSAADNTAEYDLSLVAGPIMYAGVADIAGGVIFTDGRRLANVGAAADPAYVTVGDAFDDFDGGRLARIRYDSPMLGPLQASASWGQDDQWALALTLGGAYGDWPGWTLGDVILLAAASVYGVEDDAVDYAYAASASARHDPTGLSLTLSTGGQARAAGADPSNLYAKLAWDRTLWRLGPTGFGVDFTRGDNVAADSAESTSWGLAAVQRIGRYDIDLYAQLRRYRLGGTDDLDFHDITVATFGTKVTF